MSNAFGDVPTGEEFLAEQAAGYAADNEARAVAAAAPAVADPAPDHYAPYRAQPKATFDLYKPGSQDPVFRDSLDNMLGARGSQDPDGGSYDDYLVNVRDPQGARRGVALRDLDGALAQGFKLENSQEANLGKFLDEHKGLKGDAWAAAISATDQLSFGATEALWDRVLSPEERAKMEALKSEHEFASGAGALAGFAGSMVAGGPLFKVAGKAGALTEAALAKVLASRAAVAGGEAGAEALGKSLAAKILTGAGSMAAETAVISAPHVITEAALGDPGDAAETLAYSLGAGAALGALAPIGKEIFGRAAKAVFHTPATAVGKLESYANEQAVKSHNPYLKFSARLTEIPGGEQTAGRVLRDYNLVRGTGEAFEDLAARTTAARDSVGEQIGAKYRELDKYGALADAKEVAAKLRAEILAPLEKSVGFEGKAAKVERYIASFEEKTSAAPELKAEDLLGIRRDLDTLIYGEKMPSPDQVDASYKAIRGILKKTLDSKASELEGPEFLKSLDKLNTDFRVLSILEKNAQKNIGREVTNRTNSLTDYLTGSGLASAGALAGGLLGGPGGAAVGAGAGKLVGMFGNKYLRENYNSLAVRGVDKLGVLFTEQAQRHAASQFDRIPDALRAMSSTAPRAAAEARDFAQLIGIEGSRAERFKKLSEQLAEAQANPDATSARIADITGGIAETGAPNVAAALTQKKQEIRSYLTRELPRAPQQGPFEAKREWTPNERDLIEYERKVEAAYDPIGTVNRHLARGTLTRTHVRTIQELYPGTYRKIQERVQREAASPNAPALSAPMRTRLAVLFGATPAQKRDYARYQAIYAAPSKQPQPSGAGIAKLPSPETDVQRVSQ